MLHCVYFSKSAITEINRQISVLVKLDPHLLQITVPECNFSF